MRTLYLSLVLPPALAVATCFAPASLAQRGGAPGGTVYFTASWIYRMSADGSGKTALPVRAARAEPSRELHDGHRWFLVWQPIAGESYPNGWERQELFAVRDDNQARVQLTNDPDMEPAYSDGSHHYGLEAETPRWARDSATGLADSVVSWIAARWDPATSQVVEAGIYTLAIAWELDASGNLIPAASPVPLLLVPAGRLGNWDPPSADIWGHDWSPTGTEIVYSQYAQSRTGLLIWSRDPGTPPRLLLQADSPGLGEYLRQSEWSPDGTRIVFNRLVGGSPGPTTSIETIGVDGTGHRLLVSATDPDGSNPYIHEEVVYPHWSPAGTHLVYFRQNTRSGSQANDDYDVYRIGADGRGNTNLTKDTALRSIPIGWR